jgi:thioredoxin
MAPIALTKENFSDTIQNSDVLFVDFWAGWCGPCMRFAPVYDAASDKHSDVTFAKLDTESEQDIAAALEIQAIPTLMAFKKGKLVYRNAGAMNGSQLEQLIQTVKDFDVEAAEAAQNN